MQRTAVVTFARVAVVLALSALPVQATSLTGLVVFSCDATGAFANEQAWNTVGGDRWYTLFVIPEDNIDGAFVNAGGEPVSQPLTPGTHTFIVFGQPGLIQNHFALNLFFNGEATQPGISVFGPRSVTGAQANASAETVALDLESIVPGAGSVVYTDAATTVTLTQFLFAAPDETTVLGARDRVSSFLAYPDAPYDFRGRFVLEVTPEPTAALLLGAGLVAALRRRNGASHAG